MTPTHTCSEKKRSVCKFMYTTNTENCEHVDASQRHLRTAVVGLRAAHRPVRVEVALDAHAEVERHARAVRRVGGHLV